MARSLAVGCSSEEHGGGVSDLIVLVPSRGRPGNIRRLHHDWTDTAAEADLRVCLDADDPKHRLYTLAVREPHATIGPPVGMAGALNTAAVDIAYNHRRYKYIGFLGDDHAPRTGGWDKLIVEALDHLGTGIVYGNDLFQGAALPTAVFMTANIVRALGYMVPPGLGHLFLDNVWLNWGQALNRIGYLDDVIIEHLHPAAGKADTDEGYERVNAPAQYERDGEAFRRYMDGRFHDDVTKLRALL